MSVEAFFAYARARHAIYLRRKAGETAPWTDDSVLQQYRFTNVFRELDRTTIWFRENVRERVDGPEALLAAVVFRWFNRIQTGEAIFRQPMLTRGNCTAFERLVNFTDGIDAMRESIIAYCGKGPYTTGSYIISSPQGYGKLDGVLECLRQFMDSKQPFELQLGERPYALGWRSLAEGLLNAPGEVTLESVWRWLRQHYFMGDFMAYEVVSDLRHTALLDKAPDISTWANPGPGAARGAGRIWHGNQYYFNKHGDKLVLNAHMYELLQHSYRPEYWPQQRRTPKGYTGSHDMSKDIRQEIEEVPGAFDAGAWPAWEMREVEHTLCEFDKYERTHLGEGRPRGVYGR